MVHTLVARVKGSRRRVRIHRTGWEERSIWNIAKDRLGFQGRDTSVLVQPFN